MNILVVEDNADVAELIKDTLQEEGEHDVRILDPVRTGSEFDTGWQVDFMLLDEDLGGLSGLDFLSKFRTEHGNWSGPVIMVTGKESDSDIERAFKSGVDDYITKPFRRLVLKGKVKALSTRIGLDASRAENAKLRVDMRQHRVFVANDEVSLTLTEFRILGELEKNAGKLVSREDLRSNVFDGTYVSNRTIDVHICSLRKKLKALGDPIKTIRGVGYRFQIES